MKAKCMTEPACILLTPHTALLNASLAAEVMTYHWNSPDNPHCIRIFPQRRVRSGPEQIRIFPAAVYLDVVRPMSCIVGSILMEGIVEQSILADIVQVLVVHYLFASSPFDA